MAETRRSLAEITDAVRFHIGEPKEDLSLLTDGNEADRLWALHTQIDSYVRGLRLKMLSQLRAEGISIADPQLQLPWLAMEQGGFMAWDTASLVYAPPDCETVISVYNDLTRKNIPIVSNPSRFFRDRMHLINIGTATAEPIQALVPTRYLSVTNNSLRYRQGFQVAPPQLQTYYDGATYPILNVTYFGYPTPMDLTAPDSTYPDVPEQYIDVIIYGVVASIFGKSHPRYFEFQAKEGELLLAMAREAGAAGRVQGVLS